VVSLCGYVCGGFEFGCVGACVWNEDLCVSVFVCGCVCLRFVWMRVLYEFVFVWY